MTRTASAAATGAMISAEVPSAAVLTAAGQAVPAVMSAGGVHTYKSTKPAAQTLRTSSRGSAPAAPSVGLIQLSQGDQVEHTAFGKGTVVSVKPMAATPWRRWPSRAVRRS